MVNQSGRLRLRQLSHIAIKSIQFLEMRDKNENSDWPAAAAALTQLKCTLTHISDFNAMC